MDKPTQTFSPDAETLFDQASHAPVLVERPGKGDVVVLPADTYAELLDARSTHDRMDGDAISEDPMLADLAGDGKAS